MNTAAKRTYLPTLANWLTNTVHKSADQKYHHRRLEEDVNVRADILTELQSLVHHAHEDARQKFRNALDIPYSLDPLEEQATPGIDTSIIDDFPRQLDLQTLKGYFGEIFAAVIAENFSPLDEEWHVPAFPFRFHQTAYHALEKIRQEGSPAPPIIGRFGDDMLAFQCNEQGKITHTLVCEAKCSADHDQSLIGKAHKKASEKRLVPVDCAPLAELLKDYEDTDPEAARWRQALIQLYLAKNPTHERCDLVSYICGLPPVRGNTVVIPTDKPHQDYTGGRRLEAVEIHLYDVDGLVEQSYQAITQPISCTHSEEELSTLWDKVVSYIPSTKQPLFIEHCRLLAFNRQRAVVGVRSLVFFRDVLRRKPDIRKAFLDCGVVTSVESGEGIEITFKVASAG